jgi:hypothetical protein
LGDWDRSIAKYALAQSELDPKDPGSVARAKAELLDETSWARSSGADVARNVATPSNLILHLTSAMNPSGEAVRFASDVSAEFGMRVKAQAEKIYTTIEHGTGVMDAIEGGTDDLERFRRHKRVLSVRVQANLLQ